MSLENAVLSESTELTNKGSFTRIVSQIAKDNGYCPYSRYPDDKEPRVVLLGVNHTPPEKHTQGHLEFGDIAEKDKLVAILSACLTEGDIVMQEGLTDYDKPFILPVNQYKNYELTCLLGKVLISREVRFIFNEGSELPRAHGLLLAKLAVSKKGGTLSPYESEEDLRKREGQISQERDIAICINGFAGIIPMLKGTAEIGLKEDARIYQILGLGHLHEGVIGRILKENEIPHIVLTPDLSSNQTA